MSMVATNIMQALLIMAVYSLLMVAIPALILGKKVSKRKFSERFMIYVVAGNFYIINLVYALQLLHICNWFTMILVTAALLCIVKFHKRGNYVIDKIKYAFDYFHRIVTGTIGIKTLTDNIWRKVRVFLRNAVDDIYNKILDNKLDIILVVFVSFVVCMTYGFNSIVRYGYTASDIPVHNYWINGLKDNQIFINGVYPFGYHNVIYFIHELFGIDVYVLLRLFVITQTLYLHLMLLAFVRVITKSKYPAYAAVFIYAGTALFHTNCVARYMNVLPQEYGMIFIFPSLCFIFKYFEHRSNTEMEGKNKSYITDLIIAASSFAMAFTVHFYGTFATGLCCIGILIGFITVFFRKKYLIPLMSALIASIVIAVLPLGIAVATGTPLQGSIGWGMSVIQSGNSSTDSDGNTDSSEADKYFSRLPDDDRYWELTPEEIDMISSGIWYYDFENSRVVRDSLNTDKPIDSDSEETAAKESSQMEQFLDNCKAYWTNIYQDLCDNIGQMVIDGYSKEYVWVFIVSIVVMMVLGIIFHIMKESHYGAVIISMAISSVLLHMLFLSYDFHIPQLMDQNRCRIYMSYIFMAQIMLCIDAVIYFIGKCTHLLKFINKISFIVSIGVSGLILIYAGKRVPLELSTENIYETNGAIYCLSKILNSREELEWTIVSPNDELQMIKDMGFHYETIDLLRDINVYNEYKQVTIPTKYVYFYIEKKPLNYTVIYENSGQTVSFDGAEKKLPTGSGLNAYMGENRWIVMSKMYYWAQSFRRLFPSDMTIYYEDDEFICYELIQNTSSLHNLMIDYGAN